MKHRMIALILCLLIAFSGLAVAESIGCPRMSTSCSMLTGGSCPMMADASCSMPTGSSCGMHNSCAHMEADNHLPCSVIDHTLYMDFMPPGYHYILCEDCTQDTGFQIYVCMRTCSTCGLHIHLHDTVHDCPLA